MKSIEPYAYAGLRIMSGWIFALYGMQLTFGWLGGTQTKPWTQFWVGGVLELIGGICIALGIGTRYVAFVCSGMMAVAYFQFHWRFAFDKTFWPVINKGELSILFCFIFLLFACRGGGKWALTKD